MLTLTEALRRLEEVPAYGTYPCIEEGCQHDAPPVFRSRNRVELGRCMRCDRNHRHAKALAARLYRRNRRRILPAGNA